MKLSDLKRLPLGTRLILKTCFGVPVNVGRKLIRTQSNAHIFEVDGKPGSQSYLWFPKSAELVDIPNGFRIMEDGRGAVEYEFETMPT